MAAPYSKTVWTTGDVIIQTKARNWEDGIESLSGGGIALASQAQYDLMQASGAAAWARIAGAALGILGTDSSKVPTIKVATALQSWRVNAGGTDVEAYTPISPGLVLLGSADAAAGALSVSIASDLSDDYDTLLVVIEQGRGSAHGTAGYVKLNGDTAITIAGSGTIGNNSDQDAVQCAYYVRNNFTYHFFYGNGVYADSAHAAAAFATGGYGQYVGASAIITSASLVYGSGTVDRGRIAIYGVRTG